MKIKYDVLWIVIPTVFILLQQSVAFEITIHKKDAVVWAQDQLITGQVDTSAGEIGVLFLNDDPIGFAIDPSSGAFAVPLNISEGKNTIYVDVDSMGFVTRSDTLYLTLGFELKPEIFCFAEVAGRTVSLIGRIEENPNRAELNFHWWADPQNPAELSLVPANDSLASVILPDPLPQGEYYFNLQVTTSDSDTVIARTYITVTDSSIIPFDIRFDHAQWIDKAIIYQITPYTFVPNGDLQDIIKKIPELAVLGVNTLYLQPIYETYGGGQGYDILNYFRMRPDHGTTADLRQFITTARQYGMRIMLDFVPGHSSIHHRYAKNSVQYGTDSHYYNFYKRTRDNAPYSMHYNTHPQGFLYYFWTDLPMFDYDNPEVQRWMLEAAKFWLVNFDIDGYRIDAVWGVNARNPEWAKKLRRTLKSIKPEIFLLAEDKATWPATFDESFDAAYDWSASESWVSQWTWQWDYNPSANPTIFNYPSQGSRARMLREALTNYNNGYHPRAKILRFLENNDTQPFYLHHGQARTRMAAALLFALNGIPMMYNGQEIGHSTHPYSTYNIFESYASIRSLDTKLLFPYYQALIAIRNTYPSLSSENYREIPMSPSSAQFGFHRWLGQENIFVLINMANAPVTAQATLPVDRIEIDTLKTYYLTDMLSGEFLSVPGSELSNVSISLDAYHTRIFLLADSVLSVTPLPEKKIVSPGTFALEQNYPNPFNPRTTIAFSVPDPGNVSLKIYDILGQEVMVVLNQHKMAGDHKVEFDGSGLASGVYIYQLMYQKKNIQRKMVLLK